MASNNITYKDSGKDSRFLTPTIPQISLFGQDNLKTGLIDVVNEMPWTLSPKSSRSDVPYIKLKEYQQTTGQLIASIIYFSRVFEKIGQNGIGTIVDRDQDPLESYKLKYFGEPTGYEYIFPYFNSHNLKRNNSFDNDHNPFEGILALSTSVKSLATLGIGSGKHGFFSSIGAGVPSIQAATGAANIILSGRIEFEFPKAWSSGTIESYSTTFDLHNTGTYEELVQNRKFCHLFSYQNTPSRRNFAIMDPPVIYSMRIPGIVDFPVCYVSDLTITNLGNTRVVVMDGVKRIIPEAYRISVTFTSLLMATRNIMAATEAGTVVEAIGDFTPYQKQIDSFTRDVKNSWESFGSSANPTGTMPADRASFRSDKEL